MPALLTPPRPTKLSPPKQSHNPVRENLAIAARPSGPLTREFVRVNANPKLASVLEVVGSRTGIGLCVKRLVEAMADPEYASVTVAGVVAEDLRVSSRVLDRANSSDYACRQNVQTVAEAVHVLGALQIRTIAIATWLGGASSAQTTSRSTIKDERIGSVVGRLAPEIAKSESGNPLVVRQSAIAGFLHNIGGMLISRQLPELDDAISALATATGTSRYAAELKLLGVHQGTIGAYLLWKLGYDMAVVEAVAWQRTPGSARDTRFTPLTAVHVADAMVSGGERPEVDSSYLIRVGLRRDWMSRRDLAFSPAY